MAGKSSQPSHETPHSRGRKQTVIKVIKSMEKGKEGREEGMLIAQTTKTPTLEIHKINFWKMHFTSYASQTPKTHGIPAYVA